MIIEELEKLLKKYEPIPWEIEDDYGYGINSTHPPIISKTTGKQTGFSREDQIIIRYTLEKLLAVVKAANFLVFEDWKFGDPTDLARALKDLEDGKIVK